MMRRGEGAQVGKDIEGKGKFRGLQAEGCPSPGRGEKSVFPTKGSKTIYDIRAQRGEKRGQWKRSAKSRSFVLRKDQNFLRENRHVRCFF